MSAAAAARAVRDLVAVYEGDGATCKGKRRRARLLAEYGPDGFDFGYLFSADVLEWYGELRGYLEDHGRTGRLELRRVVLVFGTGGPHSQATIYSDGSYLAASWTWGGAELEEVRGDGAGALFELLEGSLTAALPGVAS